MKAVKYEKQSNMSQICKAVKYVKQSNMKSQPFVDVSNPISFLERSSWKKKFL